MIELHKKRYPTIHAIMDPDDKSAHGIDKADCYNYLLSMPLWSLTNEKVYLCAMFMFMFMFMCMFNKKKND